MDPISGKVLRQFPGRFSDADAADIPEGAFVAQENLESLVPGRLSVRRGIVPAVFSRYESGSDTADVFALHRHHFGPSDVYVYALNDGTVHAGYGPIVTSPQPAAATRATPELFSGLSAYRRPYFASDRFGDVIGTNGLDRPIRWRLGAATADLAGIDAPSSAPAIASPAGGSLSAGTYQCYVRFVESREESLLDRVSNLSAVTAHVAVANDYLTWGISADLPASSQSRVTHYDLLRNTPGQTTVLYRAAQIGVGATITAITINAATSYVCTTSTKHDLVAGTRIKFTAKSGTFSGNADTDFAVNAYMIVTSVTDYTFTVLAADTTSTNPGGTATGVSVTFRTTGWTKTAAGAGGDTASDDDISAETYAYYLAQNVYDDEGLPDANGHTPPPNWASVVVFFQDRAHYLAPVRYSTGTVTATTGATVTGSGTAFTDAMEGRLIMIDGATRPFRILTWVSATEVTLSENHNLNLSGKSFEIYPDPQRFNEVWPSRRDKPESVREEDALPLTQLVKDHDDIVGGFELGSVLYVLKNRHLYRFWYEQQDVISARSALKASRGAFNNACHDFFEEAVYLMDQYGIWRFSGDKPEPLSPPIQDVFREFDSGATIDFERSYQFHVAVEPMQQCVYFFVHFAGDAAGLPKRWLKFNIRTGAFWTGKQVHGIGASCPAEIDGRMRLLLGSEDDHVFVANEGDADLGDPDQGPVLATAISGGAATVVIAQASVSLDDFAFASVAIYHRTTGTREARRITTNTATSGGNITITADSSWDEAIMAGDIVTIGGIVASGKTASFDMLGGEQGESENRRGVRVSYQPTDNANHLGLRMWHDWNATPETYAFPNDGGVGLRVLDKTGWIEVDTILTVDSLTENRGTHVFEPAEKSSRSERSRQSVQVEIAIVGGMEPIYVDELIVTGVD